jgi:glycosyltransferase involved in cell wall biosynthesis
MTDLSRVSIVLPAKNEAEGLSRLLPKLTGLFGEAEIIVVDDGSTDETTRVCADHGVAVHSHPYSMGNGAAVKAGARIARGDILVFMDADGQHDPNDIHRLLETLDKGFAMVVGARVASTHASLSRRFANYLYNRLAAAMTGYAIADLTSGFRAVRARPFRNFLYLLPNGFSYPTTITMAFFRSGQPVSYVPIRASERTGRSKIRIVRDGIRFFVIILKIGALFSPMRFFLPISWTLFGTGLVYYAYTFLTQHRFTNMSALLLLSSLLTFLIGILSEQVSALHYRNSEDRRRYTDENDPTSER